MFFSPSSLRLVSETAAVFSGGSCLLHDTPQKKKKAPLLCFPWNNPVEKNKQWTIKGLFCWIVTPMLWINVFHSHSFAELILCVYSYVCDLRCTRVLSLNGFRIRYLTCNSYCTMLLRRSLRRFLKIAKSDCYLSFRPFVLPFFLPNGTTRLLRDGFFMKFNIWALFENLSIKFTFH